MILIYFRTKKTIKIGYERMVISEGKEMNLNYELFEWIKTLCENI